MAKFVFKIPEIEEAVPAIQKASKQVNKNNQKVGKTYDGLFKEGFEGKGADSVSNEVDVWSGEMSAFIGLLDELSGYMTDSIIPQAKQANEQALQLASCFGAWGGLGWGGADIVTLEPDAKQEAVSLCSNIVDEYDEALIALAEIESGLSELHNPFTPNPPISKISNEIQENTEKFVSFKSALDSYADTVQSLDAMASGCLSSFSYPPNWNEKVLNTVLYDNGFQDRLNAVRENAENLKNEGVNAMIAGGLVALISATILIGTGGLAAPLVAGLVCSTAYGLSNAVEGYNMTQNAQTGNFSQRAFNPLRDTLFMGNDTVYRVVGDTISTVSLFAAGMTGPINMASRAGTSVTRAMNMYAAKTAVTGAIAVGSGYVTEQVALRSGVDKYTAQRLGLVGSVVGGSLAGAGVQRVDTSLNLSGYYTNPMVPVKPNIEHINNNTNSDAISNSKNSNTTNKELSTVGRWMSNEEYMKMSDTGKVQMSPNGNTTYVASPSSKDAFPSAPRGSLYTEFDVNSNSLYPAGNENWKQIPGPGSLIDRLNQKKGLPPITEMPDALNINKLGDK